MINFLNNLALFWVKKLQFFRQFFRQKYFKNHNIGPKIRINYEIPELPVVLDRWPEFLHFRKSTSWTAAASSQEQWPGSWSGWGRRASWGRFDETFSAVIYRQNLVSIRIKFVNMGFSNIFSDMKSKKFIYVDKNKCKCIFGWNLIIIIANKVCRNFFWRKIFLPKRIFIK
jgi:hypothetical protein